MPSGSLPAGPNPIGSDVRDDRIAENEDAAAPVNKPEPLGMPAADAASPRPSKRRRLLSRHPQ
jgi:hypothetical protein